MTYAAIAARGVVFSVLDVFIFSLRKLHDNNYSMYRRTRHGRQPLAQTSIALFWPNELSG